MASKRWVPSEMERRCLDQLSSEEGWRWLGHRRPDEAEFVGWRPFWRIYLFNLAVFGPVFLLLTGFGWRALAADDPSMRLDAAAMAILAGCVVLPALLMSAAVVGIYRRSWNRRARNLQAESEEF